MAVFSRIEFHCMGDDRSIVVPARPSLRQLSPSHSESTDLERDLPTNL